MPNLHYWLYDLTRLGVKDNKDVFFPTDDPNGFIVVKGVCAWMHACHSDHSNNSPFSWT